MPFESQRGDKDQTKEENGSNERDDDSFACGFTEITELRANSHPIGVLASIMS